MKKINFLLLIVSISSILFFQQAARAQLTDSSSYTPPPSSSEINMERSINFQPQITLPIKPFNQTSIPVGHYQNGNMSSDLLAKYIKALYDYGLMIGGILAAVVLMGGGVLWLISAGNDSKIAQAKELITGSVVGLIILFGSWVILDTINPNLTVLPSINTQVIATDNIGCCEYTYNNTKQSAMMGSVACQTNKGKFFDNSNVNPITNQYYVADPSTNSCTTQGCCIIRDSNDNIKTCSASIATNCAKVPNSSFQPNSCSSVPSELDASGKSHSCGDNTQDQCVGASNGSYCFPYLTNTHHNDANGAWCYNKTCWYGLGKKGEPCGNDQGSVCLPENSSGTSDWSLKSRICDSGLKCYKQ